MFLMLTECLSIISLFIMSVTDLQGFDVIICSKNKLNLHKLHQLKCSDDENVKIV